MLKTVYPRKPDGRPTPDSPDGKPTVLGPRPCNMSKPILETRPHGQHSLQGANGINDKSGANTGSIPGPPPPDEVASVVNDDHRPPSIELCCGHVGLTSALAKVGFQAIGFDWRGNRQETLVPIITIDLIYEQGQQTIFDLLTSGRAKYVHMGPPCGTYTRARERGIPAWHWRGGFLTLNLCEISGTLQGIHAFLMLQCRTLQQLMSLPPSALGSRRFVPTTALVSPSGIAIHLSCGKCPR